MSFLGNRKPKAVKFVNPGDTVSGIVAELNTPVQLAFDANGRPNGPKFDDAGNVVYQPEVVLALVDDKGEATTDLALLRLGGSIYTDHGGERQLAQVGSGLSYSIAEAVDKIGGGDLEVGDTLTVKFTGTDKPAAEGLNGAKLYDVTVSKG